MIKGKQRKKLAIIALILLLLISVVLGVTIAYYQDHTKVICNTFVGGVLFEDPDTQFLLNEQGVENTSEEDAAFKTSNYKFTDSTVQTITYTVLPGTVLPKKPYVVVEDLLLNAYLYIAVDCAAFTTTDNMVWTNANGISWKMDSGWTYMEQQGTVRIYRYKGGTADFLSPFEGEKKIFNIMDQNYAGTGYSVRVASTYPANATGFTLPFKAYICQSHGNEVELGYETAWNANFVNAVNFN